MEVPICVIWICLLYIVLQLHQSFLLKLLYLPTAIHTWMICQHNTKGILAVYLESFLNQEIHFGNLIYTKTPTGAKQHYSLQVGIFVTVGLQPRHAVTELLKLPNMFHHLLDFLSR